MPNRPSMTKKTSNRSGAAAIRYRPALVTFLDILGFRNLVLQSLAKDVQRALDTVRKFTQVKGAFAPLSFAFSDSIVRVRFLDGANAKEPQGLLTAELLDIVHAQGELIAHDIILRGGISSGQIYANGAEIFGPALIRAYELETKAALYPRVVLDPILLNETKANSALGRDGNTAEEDRLEFRKLLKRGENGYWFVNYLSAFIKELDDPANEPTLLAAHKRLIVRRAANAAAIDKVLWLAVYHNALISRLSKTRTYIKKDSSLVVTTKELPELARMPAPNKKRRRRNG